MKKVENAGSRREVPVVVHLGAWSSFHYTPDGKFGERVTQETATHIIVTTTEVFEK
jgi:hypothetical protein